MRIDVRPSRLGLVVMSDQRTVDQRITESLRDSHYLTLEQILGCFALRPILEVDFDISGDTSGIMVVAKFIYFRDGAEVKTMPYPQRFMAQHTRFYPHIVPNLRFVGQWRVAAEVTALRENQSRSVPDDQLVEYYMGLPYQYVGSFSWEVLRPGSVALTETGERAHPLRRGIEQLRRVAVDITDI